MNTKIFPDLDEKHQPKGIESPLVIKSLFDDLKNVAVKAVGVVKTVVKKEEVKLPKKEEAKPPVEKKVEVVTPKGDEVAKKEEK